MANNFIRGVGRLAVDRYDFEDHINGGSFNHKAITISLDPLVTINSVSCSTVQQAITELAPFAVTVPDASTSVKGIVQLAGDLSGTATSVTASASKLKGRLISSLAPSAGQVLTWDAVGLSWKPETIPTQFAAGGDLLGSSISQQVVSITGTSNTVSINCGNLIFSKTVAPIITQIERTSRDGYDLTILGQGTTHLGSNGGNITICSGYGGLAGKCGNITLQANTSPLLELSNVSDGYILSLVKGSGLTDTEMPSGTGKRVIYIADAETIPTVSPVDGTILYSYDGYLWVKQENGDSFKVNADNRLVSFDSSTEPSTWNDGWTEFDSTDTEASYYVSTLQTSSFDVSSGDIIKASFSGFVGYDDIETDGYICLLVNTIFGKSVIDGTESYITDLESNTPIHISLVGSYIASSRYDRYISVGIKRYSGSGSMCLYGGASIIMEVIRP